MKPTYYKALWYNCNKCKIHFMSEAPHLKAYLCDECWKSIPHYRTKTIKKKEPQRRIKIYMKEFSIKEILLYSIGNLICLAIIAYYLWFK